MLKNQLFGVEVEMTGITRKKRICKRLHCRVEEVIVYNEDLE